MVRLRALDFASADRRASCRQLAVRIRRAAVSAHGRDKIRRILAGDAGRASLLRRGVVARIRRKLGVAGSLDGGARDLCGVMFHALAIKCGAPRWQALAATGLLICNPCFTFLSFSFMTEIPFLTAMVAAHLAFAKAEGPREQLWLWL